MKQIKKGMCGIIALVLCISAMTGCAANPNRGSVTSKNDGVFEQNMTVAATAPLDEQLHYTDTFSSHDGTVEYTINLDQKLTSDPLPIVEVVPHFFTGEEVKNICNLFLGETEWREQVHVNAPQYSKDEIQKKLKWMTEIANENAMRELIGEDRGWEEDLEVLKTQMQYYTVMLETAPDENPRTLCDWTFKDESLYVSPSYGNYVIHATTYIGDTEYYVYCIQRDRNDYKNSRLFIGLGGNTDHLDTSYLYSKYLRTDKPSEEQLDALAAKAQNLLDQLGVGKWLVSNVKADEIFYGDTPEYMVMVNATPVLNGTAAIYDQPVENLTSEDANASNYLTTSASIYFSANGDLIYLDVCAPVDIVTVVNEGAATLSMDELLVKVKDHLSLGGIEETREYLFLSQYHDTPVTCKTEIDRVEFGLVRVKVADKDYTYYYTPALAFYGKEKFYEKDTGEEIEWFEYTYPYPHESTCLFWINAIDGSIITN